MLQARPRHVWMGPDLFTKEQWSGNVGFEEEDDELDIADAHKMSGAKSMKEGPAEHILRKLNQLALFVMMLVFMYIMVSVMFWTILGTVLNPEGLRLGPEHAGGADALGDHVHLPQGSIKREARAKLLAKGAVPGVLACGRHIHVPEAGRPERSLRLRAHGLKQPHALVEAGHHERGLQVVAALGMQAVGHAARQRDGVFEGAPKLGPPGVVGGLQVQGGDPVRGVVMIALHSGIQCINGRLLNLI